MPGQDVRQLLLQVDASVALAQRNLSALRSQVDSDTGAMEQSLARPGAAAEEAGTRIAHGANSARVAQMELMHVVRSSTDSFAAGQQVATIFAQEIGRVAEAASFAGGSMGRFGAVMAGGWGIAITAGISLLATFIGRLGATTDAVNAEMAKLRENAGATDATRAAHEAWAHTLPGIVEAIRAETQAIEDQNRSLAQSQQLSLDNARSQLSSLQQRLPEAQQAVADARRAKDEASAEDRRNQALYPESAAGRTLESAATVALQQAEARLATIVRGITAAQQAIRDLQVPIAERQAEALSDPVAAITQRYDAMRDAAIDAAHGNDQLTASLARTLASINQRRQAELDAYRESQQTHRERDLVRPAAGGVLSQFGADRSGVPLNGRLVAGRRHEGVDLRGAMGDPVVAPEGGVARVLNAPGGLGLYIEIRADSGARDLLGHLSAANIRSGDRVTAGQLVGLIGNSGNAAGGPTHLHWQRQVNGQWVDPMRSVGSSGAAQEAEQEARRAQELATRRLHDEDHYQEEMAALNTQVLNARRRAVQTEQEATAADIADIEAQREQRNTRIRAEAEERTHRDAGAAVSANIEAGFLLARSNELAEVEKSERLALERRRLAEQGLTLQIDALNGQEQIEQLHGRLAVTTRERLASELRLAELQHQEELLQIQKLRLDASLTADQRAALDRREQDANARYGLTQQLTRQENASPAAQRLRALRAEVGDVSAAFENLGVVEMDRLVDATTNEIKALLGVHGVLGDIIGDFISLALHRGEMSLLDSLMGGKSGGGGGILGSIGRLFGGGGSSYSGELLPGSSSVLPGFDDGGIFPVGGRGGIDQNILSIGGVPRARVSSDEMIAVGRRIPQVRIPQPANNNGRVHVEVSLDSGMLQAKIVGTSAGVTASLAPAIAATGSADALKTVARKVSRRIPTGF